MWVRQDIESEVERLSHRITTAARRQVVFDCLPDRPRIGDKLFPSRVDITPGPNAVEDTLEAMASGARLITRPALEHGPLHVEADLLVRHDRGHGVDEFMTYTPVVVSGHSVARKAWSAAHADCRVTDVNALGLAVPAPAPWRHRASAGESQKVAMAHVVLEQLGFASGQVALIGRAGTTRVRCFYFDATTVLPGLSAALAEPVPSVPSRVKECKVCEFHNHCRAQLLSSLDISLMLPGDKNRLLREDGISTLPQLAEADRGEASALAAAWMRGESALRRPLRRWITDPMLWGGHEFVMPAVGARPMEQQLADVVDVDVDMEAHPHRGTFLWGTFDGSRYIGFGDFSATGDDGRHVAEFWEWLGQQRTRAEGAGKRLRVWVYSEQGENYWLRFYAERHGGQIYTLADGHTITMPTLDQVNEFIASEVWCDCFQLVRKALAPTDSLGLKTLAPLAGFSFSQEGVDGKAAVHLFEQAISGSKTTAQAARRTLERYNADDCVATSAVRAWLRRGAPGIKEV